MNIWTLVVSVVIASTIAAFISVEVRAGNLPFWTTILASLLPATVWSLYTRYGTRSLLAGSFLYDIAANLAWTAVLLYSGDTLTLKGWVGVLFFFIAICLLA